MKIIQQLKKTYNFNNSKKQQLFIRFINTNVYNLNNFIKSKITDKLTPWQITGFIDGEGSFTVSKTGNSVKLEIKATQKNNSTKILYRMQEYFNCGSVVIDNRKTGTMKYRVSSLNDILTIIIPHFDKYSCLTSKFLNYQDWKKIALKMEKKEHLTLVGLKEIDSLILNMNKKRSFEDKYNYCKNSLCLTSNGEIKKKFTSWMSSSFFIWWSYFL